MAEMLMIDGFRPCTMPMKFCSRFYRLRGGADRRGDCATAEIAGRGGRNRCGLRDRPVVAWLDYTRANRLGTPLDVLSEIGVVLLLFSVGLETRLEDLKKVGKSAMLVGVLGVLLPFGMGGFWAHASGYPWGKSLFVAAAFVATSAGITARVLQELGVLQRVEARSFLARP
jgi:hypothetical protein